MPLSPNLLQRLQELKQWQESHEELLKISQNSSTNVTTPSDYQTIEGLSAFDSPQNSRKNWESQVISPTKSFNELLEEKLAQDRVPENVAPKPKKPFLKKGSGLERFKMKPKPKNKRKSVPTVTPLRAPDLSIRPKAVWHKIEDSGDHIRKINEQMPKSPGEQTLYEKALEKELLIFEALEERAENSSFCSTNSSVLRILGSTPSKIKPINEEKRVHWEPQSEEDDVIETTLERRDIADILLRLKSLADNKLRPPNVPSIIEVSEEEKWSTSSETTSISSADLEETLKSEKRDVGVGTEASTGNCLMCGNKISEYEAKIRDVIEDKNRLNDLRKELEKKERDLMKKKREFLEEKETLLFDLENERKKLLKEKHTFQTYIKDSQNRPNKKERQEIGNLKREVADLNETLKLKESKNGMTQARLRNQIKQLEKDNASLKDEIERLTKENAKLAAVQKLKRKSSDSKILHEINKNVTKLAEETRRRKGSESEDVSGKNSPFDKEDSLLVMPGGGVEAEYENAFRSQTFRREISDVTLDDGTKQVKYPNGNIKTVSPDGNFITVNFFNGDKQETSLLDGTVKYYFKNKNICQTTFADGLELIEFPEGVTEKRYPDGKCEVTLPDGVLQTTLPDGTQETKYTDGSIVQIKRNGDKVLLLPNGQKEIETKEYKSREYPDGTTKTLYPDGTQETKYANGRVRVKDANGTLIMDTHS